MKEYRVRTIITIVAIVLIIALSIIILNLPTWEERVYKGDATSEITEMPSPVVTATPELTTEPTAEILPTANITPVPTPTATPKPTVAPTPGRTPAPGEYSLTGLNTGSNGWWYGRYKGTVDGVDQYDYVLPDQPGKLVHKYNGITGHGTGKTVYLTFDEGYENSFTPKILDTLKEKNVKAAFFVTGDFVDTAPNLVKRMYQEGHIIGNHTENHPRMPELTVEKFTRELTLVEDKVNKILGTKYDMKYYRPPEGKYSERDLALAANLGYRSVFWSYAHVDWDDPKNPSQDLIDKTFKQITQSAHDQEVFLLHAVSSANAAVLGDVIDFYKAQGYTFGTLDDL